MIFKNYHPEKQSFITQDLISFIKNGKNNSNNTKSITNNLNNHSCKYHNFIFKNVSLKESKFHRAAKKMGF